MIFTQIAGRLGADPEVRFTPSGLKVTSLRVATNQRRNGEEVTVWISVSVWGDQFDKMMSYLKKGSAIIVNGRLKPPRVYNDKSGNPRAALEVNADNIQFSPFGKASEGEGVNNNASAYTTNAAPAHTPAPAQSNYAAATPAQEPQYQAASPAASSPGGAASSPMYGAYSADSAPEQQQYKPEPAAANNSSSFQEDDLPF